jgi:hypothetical protein
LILGFTGEGRELADCVKCDQSSGHFEKVRKFVLQSLQSPENAGAAPDESMSRVARAPRPRVRRQGGTDIPVCACGLAAGHLDGGPHCPLRHRPECLCYLLSRRCAGQWPPRNINNPIGDGGNDIGTNQVVLLRLLCRVWANAVRSRDASSPQDWFKLA